MNSPRFQEPAQMIESFTTAPASISLLGQIFTFALMVEPAPITTSSPMTEPSSRRVEFFSRTALQTTVPRRRQFSPT